MFLVGCGCKGKYEQEDNKIIDLNEIERAIIKYLKDNGPSSSKDISIYLSKNITTVKLTLYKLVDMCLIKTSGQVKNKRYYL